MEAITRFVDEYEFLSNFYITPVLYDNFIYSSSENAYQAAKTLDEAIRAEFRNRSMTPAMSKRYGRTLKIRQDWESIKDRVMYDVVRNKFINLKLAAMLRKTSTRYLVEGNNWHDIYWGVCSGGHGRYSKVEEHSGVSIGENKLGKILERVRYELGPEIVTNVVL